MQKIVDFILESIISIRSLISVAIVSIFFITVGSLTLWFSNSPNYNKTQGWIENVATISEISNKVIYVDHTVDNFTYEHCALDMYFEDAKVESKIKIKYNPNDPYTVSCRREEKGPLVAIYVTCYTAAALIPVAYFAIGYRRYKRRTKNENTTNL